MLPDNVFCSLQSGMFQNIFAYYILNNLSNLFTQMSRPGPAKGKHSSNTKMNKNLIFSLFSFLALSQAAYAADFKSERKDSYPCGR